MGFTPEYYQKLLNASTTPAAPAPQPAAQDPSIQQPAPASPGIDLSTYPDAPFVKGGPGIPYYLQNALGFGLPSQAEYSKLGIGGKTKEFVKGFGRAATHMIASIPAELVRAAVSIPVTGYQGVKGLVQGAMGKGDPSKLAVEQKPLNIPGVGEVPSWFKTYDDATKSGMGPLMAGVFTGGKAIGDITVVGGLGEALAGATAPRGKLVPGQQVVNTEPITQAILEDSNRTVYARKLDSANEYYNVTDTFAKQNGGNKGTIKIKVSPTADGQAEVSIVRIGKNLKDGAPSDFNGLSEVKITSETAPITKPAETTVIQPEGKAFSTESDIQTSSLSVPSKPIKGTEHFPITKDQISNLETISKANKLEPGVQKAVVNAITGKSNLGELTNAEYVQSAQALALLDKAEQFSPTFGLVNRVADAFSPRSSFFRSIEEKTGYRMASDLEIPIENGQRYMKVFSDSQDAVIEQHYGKYWKDPEAGVLVREYLQGNKGAITENATLTPQVKSDLIAIADQRAAWYDSLGEVLGVPKEKYLANYAPHVQNLGGTFQLYSEGATVPDSASFFAKHKRTGSRLPLIEDERALGQIYAHAGARTKFMGPAIERAAEFTKGLPENLQGTAKAYVLEKMGYEGQVEEMLNNTATHLNQKFGWNLPPDTARQVAQLAMDTTYAMTMGLNPGTYMRNLLSNPVFTFVENGGRYFPEAVAKALTKEGMAEIRAKGFLIESNDPYGSAIANENTQFGNAANKYRKMTAWTMKGQEVTDSFGRGVTYHQTKMIFDDAISRFNEGKIRWNQLEKELNFDGMSVVDRNEIRQQIVKGNLDGARDHMIRMKIDQTQFPYRRGTMGRAMNGIPGKVGFQFSTWTDNYVHMIGRYVKYKQYDKLMRFIGANVMVYRIMKDQFGLNYGGSLGLAPTVPSASPAVKTASSIYELLQATKDNSAEDINGNWQEIGKQFKALGFPGVEAGRAQQFLRSYNAGPIGPDGQFPVYDSQSKLIRYAPFNEIFWESLGFPTEGRVSEANLYQDQKNADFKSSQAYSEATRLWREGKYEESAKIQAENGFQLSDSVLNAQYTPRNERIFNQLPAELKGQFAPKVFK